VPMSNEASMAHLGIDDLDDYDENEEVKDAADKVVPKKNLNIWYFTVDSDHLEHQNAPTDKNWIVNISLFCRRANKNFKVCRLV
jgi:hypothetical protein